MPRALLRQSSHKGTNCCPAVPQSIARPVFPSLIAIASRGGAPKNRKDGLNMGPRAHIECIHKPLSSTQNAIMKSVLLVDDDNTLLLGIGVRLKSMGYVVITAKDAVSAVSAVVKNSPDVVVLDVSLPAGDGFLVAGRLQNLIASAATPIIFVTASEKPALRERAMKLGAVAFLAKPFDATTLADAIESALSSDASWQPLATEA